MSELETILGDLSRSLDWPEPSEHLASRVVTRIDSGTAERSRSRWAITAATAALALVIGLVPATRQAVADLFQEAGVLIGFVEETPDDLVDELDLGTPVSLSEAAELGGFGLRAPTLLGPPEDVHFDGGAVVVLWEGPVLLTQRAGGEPYAQKGIGPDTEATGVVVSGEPGLWVEGAEHTFTLLDVEGNPVAETTRLAANVLLWSAGDVDYRLELTGELDRALEIAGSMEEIDR